jgi:glycosyltransferase involved in cell wall biosynthesis
MFVAVVLPDLLRYCFDCGIEEEQMRVLALIEANSITGPAKNLLEFCVAGRQLSTPGPVDVTLVTFRRPGQPAADDFLEAARSREIACEIILQRNAYSNVTGPLREIVNRLKPDIVQTHSVKSNFWFALSGLPRRVPWVAYHHGYTKPTRVQEFYNRLDRLSLRKARALITVTPAFVEELKSAGVPPERISIVPNSIRTDWAASVKQEIVAALRSQLAPPEVKIILAVGRLSKEKAHADLVEALALVKDVPSHLVLVGDGPEREALKSLAASRDVPLTLAGQISDVAPYFALADAFVLPSHSEGSPNVLLEAMAAALPIVSTAVGGVPDTVTAGEQALLVPPWEPQALANAIRHLLTDGGLAARLAASARSRATARFSPEVRVRTIARIYERVLASSKA